MLSRNDKRIRHWDVKMIVSSAPLPVDEFGDFGSQDRLKMLLLCSARAAALICRALQSVRATSGSPHVHTEGISGLMSISSASESSPVTSETAALQSARSSGDEADSRESSGACCARASGALSPPGAAAGECFLNVDDDHGAVRAPQLNAGKRKSLLGD